MLHEGRTVTRVLGPLCILWFLFVAFVGLTSARGPEGGGMGFSPRPGAVTIAGSPSGSATGDDLYGAYPASVQVMGIGGSIVPSTSSTVTLAAAVGDSQVATITLKDISGTTLTTPRRVHVYMCTDAAGATPSSAGAATSVTVGGGGALLSTTTAELDFQIVVGATGIATLTFNNTGGSANYTDRVALELPSGALIVSSALNVPHT
jgi:hypothetical protein